MSHDIVKTTFVVQSDHIICPQYIVISKIATMVVSDMNPKQRFISLRFSVQLELLIKLSLLLFDPSNNVYQFKLFFFLLLILHLFT